MRQINVMHLRSNYEEKVGGPERIILGLAKQRDVSRFNMVVVSLRHPAIPESYYLKELRALGVKTESISWTKLTALFALYRLGVLLKKYRVDILHTHDVRTDILGWVASRLRGVSIISWVHFRLRAPLKFWLHDLLDDLVIRFFDRVVVSCRQLREELLHLRIPASKIKVIHYAIDTQRFEVSIDAERVKKSFGLNPENMVIGIIGRLAREKDHETFLKAAQQVLSVFPQARFLIVGRGPLKRELESLAMEFGIFQSVIFAGFYENLPEVLAIMDVVVSVSLIDTGPLVVLEAMAAGKPVVATRVGLTPEVVKDKETGLLVPFRDPERLSEAILALLRDNKEMAESMGLMGQRLLKERFSAGTMARKMEDLYLGLFNSRRRW